MLLHPLAQRGGLIGLGCSGNGGTSAGGGGGGVPRICSRIHFPRMTGEVRVGVEVASSTAPCVSTPPRAEPGGSVTR